MATVWGCFIIHTHDGACPTDGGSVIQDQLVGTIQSSPVSPLTPLEWSPQYIITLFVTLPYVPMLVDWAFTHNYPSFLYI